MNQKNLPMVALRACDVAIVGAAGRFPGADSVDALWQILLTGREPYRILTPEQLSAAGHGDLARMARYVPQARIPEHYDCFDAAFFGYSPREAAFMDPQQRLLLECAWHVFENAGHPPGDCDGLRTAVFASVGANGYSALHALPQALAGNADMLDCIVGNDKDYCASRLAYKLNLSGAAISVQTACSSSLVAVHLAVQALLNHEADRALVAAASLSVPTEVGYLAEESGIRSPDGHCRPFDANSNGTVFASGVAGVLLRRLDDAIASGDSILAVIRATAINNDGSARVGFTAPGLQGQVDVISEALQVAQVDAADLAYVECHGTGTRLGDPIEVGALDQAWRANSTHDLPPRHCLVGSVKSNIGHLDTVAGLAGLIKTAYCLHHGEIPPTLHYASPNPEIGLARTPFQVADQRQPWPAHRKRLAGVSAFGFGGTNAHAVLEAAPAAPAAPAASEAASARNWHCLVLSAADEPALQRQASALADWIENHPGADLADIGYTLQVGRRALPWRGALLARDAMQAVAGLRRITGVQSQSVTSPLWLFPGQGAHYPGMASALYAAEPAFRDALSRMLLMLPKNAPVDAIRGLLLDAGGAQIDDTAIVQPALFIYEVALGQTLLALGLVPSALLGHSLGELSAACLAGVFELEQACSLVCLRGALMADLPPGGMVLVHCDAESVQARLAVEHPALDLAVVNSPACCVVGGPRDAIDAFTRAADALGWQSRQLRTSHAFHTRMMDPALSRYRQAIRERVLSEPRWPLLSGQDGQRLSGERAMDPEYWVQQLRHTVRFDQALASTWPSAVVEVGPVGGLLAFARDAGRMPAVMLSIGGSRHQDASARHGCLVQGIARLWQAGDAVDWLAFNQPWLPRRRVALPPYPFTRERHWLPSSLPVLQALRKGNATLAPIQTPAGNTIAAGPPAINAGIAYQPRPALETPYVAPNPGMEQRMAGAWQDLLFIADVGRHDDFFALGGNSILALRLCQQGRECGWTLTPQQVFQHRDIAALCAVQGATADTPVAQVMDDVDPQDLQALMHMLDRQEAR